MTGAAPGKAEPAGLPAGLYLHVPFCSAVCPYCDFAVRKLGRGGTASFVDAVIAEIDALAGLRGPATLAEPLAGLFAGDFDTLYFGGGTPSLLGPPELERLLETLRTRLRCRPDTRLFFEANPEDVAPPSLQAWRALGVETLSLGIQSFDDAELRFLGRRHDGRSAVAAVAAAREAGFATLSIDLIYGLPGQVRETWERNLRQAVALAPDHLSLYELELHERTPFGKAAAAGRLRPLPEDAEAELFLFTHDFLAEHGYPAYEVSNFARGPEHQSRHNRKYWSHTPYLGLGPGAHSFAGGHRWWHERSDAAWRRRLAEQGHGVAGCETLTRRDLALEMLMLGLRTALGVDLALLRERSGIDLWARNSERLERWQGEGLVEVASGRLRPTRRGFAVADRLAAELELPG